MKPATSAAGRALANLSTAQLLRGDAAEDEPLPLRAGPLTAELHGIELAYVRLGDREILRRIYASLRDENWDTVLPTVASLRTEQGDDSFTVTFVARHAEGSIAFSWNGRIEGSADGTISYSMEGETERAFRYCRIGFCLLHAPEEYSGRPYRASVGATAPQAGSLPVAIAPQLFRDGIYHPIVPTFTQLDVDLAGGVTVRLDVEGDLFEIEDQRNWTDASYKTYCTPAHLGYPFDAAAGQRFDQRVTFTLATGKAANRARVADSVRIQLGEQLAYPIPEIGTTAVPLGRSLSKEEQLRLRTLGARHLRVDVDLDDPGARTSLRQAAADAATVASALEVALFASETSAPSAGELLRQTCENAELGRVLVFYKEREVTPRGLIDTVRQSLAAAEIATPLGGGTDLWFAEINRDPPDPAALDFLSYSITPQVHAFDDVSLVETLAMQAETVRATRTLAPRLPIVVSPVTLRPRNSAVTIDPRQRSLFCAAWTVGSIRYLAESGTAAVTYYESFGPRGLMEPTAETLAADDSSLGPGVVFPVYHVLRAVATLSTGAPLRATSSDPRRVEAFASTTDTGIRLLAANLHRSRQRVRIRGIDGSTAAVRLLDSGTVRQAMSDPEGFEQSGAVQPVDGDLGLDLDPYAVAFIDVPAPATR